MKNVKIEIHSSWYATVEFIIALNRLFITKDNPRGLQINKGLDIVRIGSTECEIKMSIHPVGWSENNFIFLRFEKENNGLIVFEGSIEGCLGFPFPDTRKKPSFCFKCSHDYQKGYHGFESRFGESWEEARKLLEQGMTKV